ncbi:uncharacterized protein LOC110716737 [Chenopodium quinoa]|uniref:uncharacterized protein LOC110716737 n=1 Tax=Chenopodium quinoa TaxID=63459 RepID=UPI000B7760FC|nr:uncharacterized protein LOC110716737 [Chenopodium quinoa]
MGVYKLPNSVIDEIRSLTARFWWENSDARRRVHWLNWEVMCTPKCLGGMGFRDMGVFNEALLGKQAWRLINNPGSLFGRVMKGKYFPHSDFLESSLGFNGSYAWRGIWGAKSLVKEGVVWSVGDGSKIRIFEDPWLADEKGRFVFTLGIDRLNVVKDLINVETNDWDYELLFENFEESDVKCIMTIPLSLRTQDDILTWAFSKDGVYDVKSAYMIEKTCDLGAFHQVWVDIWGLDTIPKVKLFLW